MAHQKGGQQTNIQGTPNNYTYNGKELNTDFGLDWLDYGARWYDASIARWSAVDPLAEIPENISWSTYTYVWNNPIQNIDPDGRSGESTIVEEQDDGTHVVVAAYDDDDNGVYINDGDLGKGQKIGESISPISFMNDDGSSVAGAVIDLNSTEGQDFLYGLYEDSPGLIEYAAAAKGGEPYDFKTNCLDKTACSEEQTAYMYRGYRLADGKIASARDIGNIGAGYVAGEQGLGWLPFRYLANTLETKQKNKSGWLASSTGYIGTINMGGNGVSTFGSIPIILRNRHQEGETTQNAQKYGFEIGKKAYRERLKGEYKP